jgi:hypothetical protein
MPNKSLQWTQTSCAPELRRSARRLMRLHFGKVPEEAEFEPLRDGWTPLKEPKSVWITQLLALPVAFVLVLAVAILWWLTNPVTSLTLTITTGSLHWLLIGMSVVIVAHESLHLIVHPGLGTSKASIAGFWPSKLIFYAHYEGAVSRNRFLAILSTPFIVLSIIPIIVSSVFRIWPPWLIAVSLVNAFSACVDILGIFIVLCQVPSKGLIRNKGWRSFWRVEYSQLFESAEPGDSFDPQIASRSSVE